MELNQKFEEIAIELPRQVNEEIAGDIEKESVFVSPAIEKIVVDSGYETAIVHLKNLENVDSSIDKARRFVEVMAKHHKGFESKVFFETRRVDTGEYIPDVNVILSKKGWIYEYGKGQVAYSGPVLKLSNLLNKKAGELYKEAFNAQDGHYPALVDSETLHKCGYFDSHPNAVTFVGNMMEDFDAIEAFRQANSCSEGAIMPPQDHVHMDGMCLNPAACFPCYPTLEGKVYETGEAFTWMGRVFRYESRNIHGLDRLYEFSVRELVFVGTENYVSECRSKALPIVEKLANHLDIDCVVETATDPFFATVSMAKKFWQATQEVKNEIKIPIVGKDGETKRIACGSVNLHGEFFGEKFEIRDVDGNPAHTGCVGLGIERWILAAFTQHGFDPIRWPEEIREEIFS